MEEVELYFDGVSYTCVAEEDRNGELLFVAPNGRFVKFPAGSDLEEVVAAHNAANSDEVEAIPDVVYGLVETNN